MFRRAETFQKIIRDLFLKLILKPNSLIVTYPSDIWTKQDIRTQKNADK